MMFMPRSNLIVASSIYAWMNVMTFINTLCRLEVLQVSFASYV